MIKPTVGRVVWFHDTHVQSDQPMAAIVTYVHNDELVNLTVFTSNGLPTPRTSVKLWQGEGDRPRDHYAEWMPYQKGQAAKTEELEKKLSQ